MKVGAGWREQWVDMRLTAGRLMISEARVFGTAAACALVALAGQARAEQSGALSRESSGAATGAADLPAKRLELRGVEDTIDAASGQKRKLEGDIATLRADRERLNQTLLDATRRLQDAERRAGEIELRLDSLKGAEEAIVKSLDSRRASIGEVLMALQRMGRRPPPALLVKPEDILQAIRATMALGAVLPRMREETQALQADLTELVGLRAGIEAEQSRLAREKDDLSVQRVRLGPIIDQRQQALSQAQDTLDAESERARRLAGQATSLKDLILRMEAESEAARRGAEAARKADATREAADAALSREQRAKALATPFKDAARLAPAAAFADLKSRLPLPASGPILRRFGASDGFGGAEKGLSIGAPEKGVVVAPCDGWIAFSGPYRGYGQLLIINAGAGYYVVLAGMSRMSVNVGQFVLAGEPVAIMGDGAARTAATVAIGAKQPILYVEFRKDGTAIDSSPWWAKSDIRKVGG